MNHLAKSCPWRVLRSFGDLLEHPSCELLTWDFLCVGAIEKMSGIVDMESITGEQKVSNPDPWEVTQTADRVVTRADSPLSAGDAPWICHACHGCAAGPRGSHP